MPIRACLCGWSIVDTGDGREVRNAVADHLAGWTGAPIMLSMGYGDADADGLPDRAAVLVIVESTAADLDVALAGVPAVVLPSLPIDTLLADLPRQTQDDLLATASALSIPPEVWASAETVADLLRAFMVWLAPAGRLADYYLGRIARGDT